MIELVRQSLIKKNQTHSLVYTILEGPEEDIKGLLQSASINESSLQGTPLTAAAKIGRLDLVQDLLQRGADPNAKTEIGNQTALYQAAERGHVEIVKILVLTYREEHIRLLHWTPLHAAAISGHAQIVEHLLDAGIRRDAQDEEGMTALAYSGQQLDVIIHLLGKGAEDLPDKRKNLALDHAMDLCKGKDNEEILKLLRGADFMKRKLSSRASETFNRHNC